MKFLALTFLAITAALGSVNQAYASDAISSDSLGNYKEEIQLALSHAKADCDQNVSAVRLPTLINLTDSGSIISDPKQPQIDLIYHDNPDAPGALRQAGQIPMPKITDVLISATSDNKTITQIQITQKVQVRTLMGGEEWITLASGSCRFSPLASADSMNQSVSKLNSNSSQQEKAAQSNSGSVAADKFTDSADLGHYMENNGTNLSSGTLTGF